MGPRGEKRDQIMRAAIELFAQRGFHAVTVPMVAKHAGVGAGTLYHYFSSKEELVNALYQQYKLELIHAVSHEFPEDLPPRKRFREMFHRFVGFSNSHQVEAAFLYGNNHSSYIDEQSCKLDERMTQWLTDFIQRAIDDEAIKPLPPLLHMAVVGGILESLANKCSVHRVELTDELLTQAEEMAWHAVRR